MDKEKSNKNKYIGKYTGCIGIDLGTTNCVVTALDCDGQPVLIKDEDGQSIIPSFIYFYEDEDTHKIKYKIGNKAKDMMSICPNDVISSYKTFMGKRDKKTNSSPIIKVIKTKELTAETCSLLMLAYLKKIAEDFMQVKVDKAVITVPAYFSEAQKQATIFSAQNAGLQVLKLVNEPTAATYYYNKELKENEDNKIVLTFDLGGGTFDLSLLSLERDEDGKPESNVIAVSGDANLGGDDIDKAIASFIAGKPIATIDDKEQVEKIIRIAEDCKKYLSIQYSEDEMDAVYKPSEKGLKSVKMKDFLNLIKPFVDRCLKLTKEIVMSNDLKDEIEDILLVGGSTRLPLIREGLIKIFDGRFNMDYFERYIVSPDFAVSYGARTVMKNILDEEDVNLSDIVPIPIHVETETGLETILKKGQPVPSIVRKAFLNSTDYQSSIKINIYEGFDILASNNTLLGSVTIPIKPSLKNTIPVMVRIKVNKDFVLEVSIKVENKTKVLKIERHFNSNDTDVNDVLEEMSTEKDIASNSTSKQNKSKSKENKESKKLATLDFEN